LSNQPNIYDTITTKIIMQLEDGVRAWNQPWVSANQEAAFKMPLNPTTGKDYRGVNILLLWGAAEEKGFTTNEWATFKQWSYAKQSIRKGEKQNLIVFYDKMVKENEKGEEQVIPFLKTSYVFNRCQLQGYKYIEPQEKPMLFNRINAADNFIKGTGAIIHNTGDRAFYRRTADEIYLPPEIMFTGSATQTPEEAYYSTGFHELGHWTGSPTRLNRQFGKRFGDQDYAVEELVAEISAAFTSCKLGITDAPREDHAQYLANWLTVLKNDNRAIVTAASKAQEATDYLFNLQQITKPANDNRSPVAAQLRAG
jgi:antirestriction protein ArdC